MRCNICEVNGQRSYASMYCPECYLATCSLCRTHYHLWWDNLQLDSREQAILMSAEQLARQRHAGQAGQAGNHKHKWTRLPQGFDYLE